MPNSILWAARRLLHIVCRVYSTYTLDASTVSFSSLSDPGARPSQPFRKNRGYRREVSDEFVGREKRNRERVQEDSAPSR